MVDVGKGKSAWIGLSPNQDIGNCGVGTFSEPHARGRLPQAERGHDFLMEAFALNSGGIKQRPDRNHGATVDRSREVHWARDEGKPHLRRRAQAWCAPFDVRSVEAQQQKLIRCRCLIAGPSQARGKHRQNGKSPHPTSFRSQHQRYSAEPKPGGRSRSWYERNYRSVNSPRRQFRRQSTVRSPTPALVTTYPPPGPLPSNARLSCVQAYVAQGTGHSRLAPRRYWSVSHLTPEATISTFQPLCCRYLMRQAERRGGGLYEAQTICCSRRDVAVSRRRASAGAYGGRGAWRLIGSGRVGACWCGGWRASRLYRRAEYRGCVGSPPRTSGTPFAGSHDHTARRCRCNPTCASCASRSIIGKPDAKR